MNLDEIIEYLCAPERRSGMNDHQIEVVISCLQALRREQQGAARNLRGIRNGAQGLLCQDDIDDLNEAIRAMGCEP